MYAILDQGKNVKQLLSESDAKTVIHNVSLLNANNGVSAIVIKKKLLAANRGLAKLLSGRRILKLSPEQFELIQTHITRCEDKLAVKVHKYRTIADFARGVIFNGFTSADARKHSRA